MTPDQILPECLWGVDKGLIVKTPLSWGGDGRSIDNYTVKKFTQIVEPGGNPAGAVSKDEENLVCSHEVHLS